MFQDIHNNVFIDPSNLALFPGLSPRLLSLAFHNASDKSLGTRLPLIYVFPSFIEVLVTLVTSLNHAQLSIAHIPRYWTRMLNHI